MNSVPTLIALMKPYVKSVEVRSLSIVFGTPMTLTPFLLKSLALVNVPSPPNTTNTSTPSFLRFSTPTSLTSFLTFPPFPSSTR